MKIKMIFLFFTILSIINCSRLNELNFLEEDTPYEEYVMVPKHLITNSATSGLYKSTAFFTKANTDYFFYINNSNHLIHGIITEGKESKNIYLKTENMLQSLQYFFDAITKYHYLITSDLDHDITIYKFDEDFQHILTIKSTGIWNFSTLIFYDVNTQKNYIVVSNEKGIYVYDFRNGDLVKTLSTDSEERNELSIYSEKDAYGKVTNFIICSTKSFPHVYNFETGLLYNTYHSEEKTQSYSSVVSQIYYTYKLSEIFGIKSKVLTVLIQADNTDFKQKIKFFDFHRGNLIYEVPALVNKMFTLNDKFIIFGGNDSKISLFDLERFQFFQTNYLNGWIFEINQLIYHGEEYIMVRKGFQIILYSLKRCEDRNECSSLIIESEKIEEEFRNSK